jgi:hypothetical protein
MPRKRRHECRGQREESHKHSRERLGFEGIAPLALLERVSRAGNVGEKSKMINLIGGVSHSRFDLIVAKLFG